MINDNEIINLLLCEREQCTGCMACYNICQFGAISMEADEKGFPYPYIVSEKCINCKKCQNICPNLKNAHKNKNENIVSDLIYAGWVLDEKIRMESSSGGICTLLAEYIFSQNGIVCGAAYDKNMDVTHQCALSDDGYKKFRGSKYVQSIIGNTFQEVKEYLKQGKSLLFIGTPCQLDGLYSYLDTEDLSNLYTVDLICHGTPSPLIFKEYRTYMENCHSSPIQNILFRDKKNGWKEISVKTEFEDGSIDIKKMDDSPYLSLFLNNIILRDSCYQCKYTKMNRVGDITLGDFWKFSPTNINERDEDKGISGIIINTDKGKYLFSKIKGSLNIMKRSKEELIKGNVNLQKPTVPSKKRNDFWMDYHSKGFQYVIKKYATKTDDALKLQKKVDKFKINYQILIEWLAKKQNGNSINKYFIEHDYKKICLYGTGELGLRFIDELAETESKIICCLDKANITEYENIPVFNDIKEIPKIDVIVISIIWNFDEIKSELSHNINCPIVSLHDVIFYN